MDNANTTDMGKALRHGEMFLPRRSWPGAIADWFERQVWVQKFDNPLGLGLLLLAVLPVSYILSVLEFKVGMVFFLGLIGLPLIGFCLFDLVFALGMMLFVSVMVVFGAKFTTAPIGLLLDLLILISGVSLLLRQIKERDWSFAKGPMSYMILVWLYFNFLQVLNPGAESKMAWLFTVRSVAIQQLVFFVGAYALRDNFQGTIRLVKFIVLICFLGGLYGLKQEYFGFSAAEKLWIYSDRERFEFYYQWGRMRIPSFCFDPTTFGILMACFAVFCLTLIAGPTKRSQKIWLSIMIIVSLLSMAYTGTRTAFVLVPIGAVFYAGMILNKNVFIVSAIGLLFGTAFILKSSSSGVVYRIQSAFKPTEDKSMNVRLENQKFIQPYIQSHPIGGGLGSCGQWGKRFNPNSELAKFPHDSSFVRMAVELGWIGLMLYTLFHYTVLRIGIYYFVRVRDPLIKTLYAGITTWCFMLTVACYAQEAILQLPTNIVYNIFLAMLVTMKNFDPAYRQTATQSAAPVEGT